MDRGSIGTISEVKVDAQVQWSVGSRDPDKEIDWDQYYGYVVGKLPKNIVIIIITRDVPGIRLINTLQKSAFTQIITAETEEATVCHVPECPLIVLSSECPLTKKERGQWHELQYHQ